MSNGPEFTRPMHVGEVTEEGRSFEVAAKEAECAALARRFAIAGLRSLSAEGCVRRGAGRTRFQLSGRLRAEVVQICVVTLQPLDVQLDVAFEREYATDARDEWGQAEAPGAEIVLSLDNDDAPEPLEGGVLDVGEAVAQELSLALDPFPRKPGAVFDEHEDGAPVAASADNSSPFAALASFKNAAKKR